MTESAPLFASERTAANILVTSAEAAKIMGETEETFLHLVRLGVLPGPVLRHWWRRAEIVAIVTGKFRFSPPPDEREAIIAEIEDAEIERRVRARGRTPSQKLRAEVFEQCGEVCYYCGDEAGPFVLDHMIPWSRGGETSSGNLCVCCVTCNDEKGDMTPEEWEASRK